MRKRAQLNEFLPLSGVLLDALRVPYGPLYSTHLYLFLYLRRTI